MYFDMGKLNEGSTSSQLQVTPLNTSQSYTQIIISIIIKGFYLSKLNQLTAPHFGKWFEDNNIILFIALFLSSLSYL